MFYEQDITIVNEMKFLGVWFDARPAYQYVATTVAPR
jgi:hypothetical protein